MCDPVQLGLEIAREGASISNAVEKDRRTKQAKEARDKIQTETDNEIAKQANQFGENGEVIVTNKKQTTTQSQKRKQLISLRLNNPTDTKPVTGTNTTLGLNI